MAKAYHEALKPAGILGIQVSMAALESKHIPMHWHEEMEILFCLNGGAHIQIGNEMVELEGRQLVVFDSKVVHSIHVSSRLYMFLCIHIDKKQLVSYIPDIELYKIECRPIALDDKRSMNYIHICQLAADLTRINFGDEITASMCSDGTVLLILSDLIRYFSNSREMSLNPVQNSQNEMIRDIIRYVQEHYDESVSLAQIASEFGISREYFCRFFKSNMGITFLQYLNEVRIAHAGRLLITTDLPISQVMERSGFTNQTIFNRTFKEIYGMTPREIRKTAADVRST